MLIISILCSFVLTRDVGFDENINIQDRELFGITSKRCGLFFSTCRLVWRYTMAGGNRILRDKPVSVPCGPLHVCRNLYQKLRNWRGSSDHCYFYR